MKASFATKSAGFGRQSSRFDEFVGNREIYNLSMVSGPAFKQNKRECWISILLEVINDKKRNMLTKSVEFWSPDL